MGFRRYPRLQEGKLDFPELRSMLAEHATEQSWDEVSWAAERGQISDVQYRSILWAHQKRTTANG